MVGNIRILEVHWTEGLGFSWILTGPAFILVVCLPNMTAYFLTASKAESLAKESPSKAEYGKGVTSYLSAALIT